MTTSSKLTVALIGNPNTGKSTLFSGLCGYRVRTGNYPGVTVEKKLSSTRWGETNVTLIDLPGTYSLSPRSLDEMVSVDVLLGRQVDVGEPDVVVCIVDASNLERNLFLVSQVLDMQKPTVLVLNMCDVAETHGVTIDIEPLSQRLGVPVIKTLAHRKQGLEEVKNAVIRAGSSDQVPTHQLFPDLFYAECETLSHQLKNSNGSPGEVPGYLLERLLLDVGGHVESHFVAQYGEEIRQQVAASRGRLEEAGCKVPAVEAIARYGWIRENLNGVLSRPEHHATTPSDKIDRFLTNRFTGVVVFLSLMFLVFQAIYAWAGPLMDFIEGGQTFASGWVVGLMPPGALRSLLVDGIIGGVGSVIIFLPQICFLFFFIALLEDCGYMARAAFLMDRVMTCVGLSGKSFVPLMSSFACAIPGVMATRVIENPRDRLLTILVAPLMSCSARLPVYVLLIWAFIPPETYFDGWVSLRGMVLFIMHFVGLIVAVPVAWILKKTLLKGETPPFVMELPSYKIPSVRVVLDRVYDRGKAFIVRAGTLIFATTIVVWAAGYFPGDRGELHQLQAEIEKIEAMAESEEAAEEQTASLVEKQNQLSASLIKQSALGRVGHAIEPVVKPLGWDWRIGVGVIASFPAREVIIATLGTIYSLGGDIDIDEELEDEDKAKEGLIAQLQTSQWPDGNKVFNIPVAISVMVFFALCAQCGATLMVIKRETNSWAWPIFTFVYMTALAYVGALLSYQVSMLFA